MKNENVKDILNLTLRLLIITVAAGLILGLVYTITKDPIIDQELKKATLARQAVLPVAKDFEQLEISDAQGKYLIIKDVYKGLDGSNTVGYTAAIATKGFSPNFNITVGLSAEGKVTGVSIGSHEETPGLGANATKEEYTGQYIDGTTPFSVAKTPTGADNEIIALTGATITSKAVTDAVNTVGEYFNEFLTGGV